MSTYETLANFAQTWGLLYFVLIFAGVLVYTLWPSNKDKFEDASHVPLRED